jgi:hypothetical protein
MKNLKNPTYGIVKPILRGYWQGNENFFIDKISGKLAGEFTPIETTEERILTNVHSILYWVDRSNIMGPPPMDPTNNSQFSHWETPIQDWWAQNKNNYPITTLSDKPEGVDDVHTDISKPIILINEPNDLTLYSSSQKIQLNIESSGIFPLQKIDIFINDVYLGTIKSPFSFSFIPNELDNLRSENEIKIISYDTAFNRSETTALFKVSR